MDAGLFSAATGMIAKSFVQDIIGRNLANANTNGYKRERVVEGDFARHLNSAMTLNPLHRVKSGSYVHDVITDFSEGPLKETENIFDLALNGEGFFTVQGPEGQLYYTRDGSFQINQNGELVTKEGLKVLGEGGTPIVFPPEAASAGAFEGAINIGEDGSVFAFSGNPLAKTNVGRLNIVNFENPEKLTRLGAGFYSNALGNAAEQPSAAKVVQGALEGANFSMVEEMVDMIKNQRYFDSAQSVITTIDKTFTSLFSVLG